jgi:hypothetical protein
MRENSDSDTVIHIAFDHVTVVLNLGSLSKVSCLLSAYFQKTCELLSVRQELWSAQIY